MENEQRSVWDAIDWPGLERLREAFLEGRSGQADYWTDERALASYDLTFAARIGWKWDFVLGELRKRGWSPPAGRVFDWGCGTGVAGRIFLHHFGAVAVREVALWDRSKRAVDFAAARLREEQPGVVVNSHGEQQQRGQGQALSLQQPGTLLVSHVITELSPRQLDELVEGAALATAVVWVEPGTHEASRRLIGVRERLREQFTIKGPCTHQAVCGLLAAGQERHWCHQFAPSPAEIHQDANWSRFARLMGVDLRSLPLSFLVLDKRVEAAALPAGAVRIIGRPRVHKADAQLFGCDASGVRDRRLLKRHFPEEFRRLKRDEADSLQVWRLEGDEIVEVSPVAL
jgi:hypothetical protein